MEHALEFQELDRVCGDFYQNTRQVIGVDGEQGFLSNLPSQCILQVTRNRERVRKLQQRIYLNQLLIQKDPSKSKIPAIPITKTSHRTLPIDLNIEEYVQGGYMQI